MSITIFGDTLSDDVPASFSFSSLVFSSTSWSSSLTRFRNAFFHMLFTAFVDLLPLVSADVIVPVPFWRSAITSSCHKIFHQSGHLLSTVYNCTKPVNQQAKI